MFLALNTFVYDVARVPVEQALPRARKFGFRFIEYSTYQASNPTTMSQDRRRMVVAILKDNGLYSAQMLLTDVGDLAARDEAKRCATLDYMKRCGEFQLELGGKQLLICRGGGFYEPDVIPERSWLWMIEGLRELAEWCLPRGLLIDLEIEPHVYFLTNTTAQAAKIIQDVAMPNVVVNVDIGHLCILRESPNALEKLARRIVQIHLSETNAFDHTNSILGTGVADFKPYLAKAIELGIEENCKRYGEPCVAGIEMGARGGYVDDADRWVRESVEYLKRLDLTELEDLSRLG
ncbi:MAG: sugar phosphate isomerase/epimerase [Anaerolineales bacterium]|nr:sugar phosphate isomerase/epimerase [Anaerolineales bacterium]